jgi:UPF0271 protein
VQDGTTTSVTGEVIEIRGDTICLHGDTPGAGELAARLRSGLEAAGIRVVPIGTGGKADALRRQTAGSRRQHDPDGYDGMS